MTHEIKENMKTNLTYEQRRNFLLIVFLIGVVLIAIVAQATTLVRLTFPELVKNSSAIAHVRCLGSQAVFENGEIWTDTSLEVLESNKGNLPAIVVVRQPGGKLAHLESRVDGTPQFRVGEELYLFLEGQPGGRFFLVGWSQGTFRVRRNPRTGLTTVTQDSAEIPAYDQQSREFTKTGVKDMRLDSFREQLRREMLRQVP
jgi:hypothetical protein